MCIKNLNSTCLINESDNTLQYFLQERQIKQEEYRDLASSLCMWLKEATNIMMDKTFPTTLIEMRVSINEGK